jgi:hypothetical protein
LCSPAKPTTYAGTMYQGQQGVIGYTQVHGVSPMYTFDANGEWDACFAEPYRQDYGTVLSTNLRTACNTFTESVLNGIIHNHSKIKVDEVKLPTSPGQSLPIRVFRTCDTESCKNMFVSDV